MKQQKQNKYAHLNTVQAEFDYHGLDPFLGESGIVKLTEAKLKDFKKQGYLIIRLIVGKGNHSKSGAVIQPIVLKYLKTLQQQGQIQSFEFDTAHGIGPNSGAIIVKL